MLYCDAIFLFLCSKCLSLYSVYTVTQVVVTFSNTFSYNSIYLNFFYFQVKSNKSSKTAEEILKLESKYLGKYLSGQKKVRNRISSICLNSASTFLPRKRSLFEKNDCFRYMETFFRKTRTFFQKMTRRTKNEFLKKRCRF